MLNAQKVEWYEVLAGLLEQYFVLMPPQFYLSLVFRELEAASPLHVAFANLQQIE